MIGDQVIGLFLNVQLLGLVKVIFFFKLCQSTRIECLEKTNQNIGNTLSAGRLKFTLFF